MEASSNLLVAGVSSPRRYRGSGIWSYTSRERMLQLRTGQLFFIREIET
jgi:hypothetical protein